MEKIKLLTVTALLALLLVPAVAMGQDPAAPGQGPPDPLITVRHTPPPCAAEPRPSPSLHDIRSGGSGATGPRHSRLMAPSCHCRIGLLLMSSSSPCVGLRACLPSLGRCCTIT